MSPLEALTRYYGRMAARGEAEMPGWTRARISFCLTLSPDGAPHGVMDLRVPRGRRLEPRLLEVPDGGTRTSGVKSCFLWDKTAYVFGRAADPRKNPAREHAAFRRLHAEKLAGTADAGLLALSRFLTAWDPAGYGVLDHAAEMLDTNVVFRLEGEQGFLHERPAARALVETAAPPDAPVGFCLVTGEEAPIARLHPGFKVEGAQSSGAALVSFNNDAFESYGQKQGANASTSEGAAFRYGAALSRMLDRDSRNRLPRLLGDTTLVFWADATDAQGEARAQAAEELMAALFEPPAATADPGRLAEDAPAARRLSDALARLAAGRPVEELDPRLDPGTRFFVLGLAPNAGRLSVRIWEEGRLEGFARRLALHHADLRILPEPLLWGAAGPSVQRLLVRTTAAQEKFENIPPLLAGEVMRAILAGTPYPRTLLAAALMRLRAGADPGTGWHAAAIRAVLAREHRLLGKEDVPVALDRHHPSTAYQIGRLFAMIEIAQRMALGRLNAPVRDRYFGAASATPATVFPLLIRGMQNHLARLRKDGRGGWVERELNEIIGHLGPDWPRSLPLAEQGRFAVGYYHQRRARVGDRTIAEQADAEAPSEGDESHD